MNTIRFTKATLLNLPLPEAGKRAEYADSVVNGLRLRITSSGSKSFCVSRKRDGKFYRITLGKFPDMTIEQARERAYAALSEVATTRRNPNERRREEKKKLLTLSDALDEYIKSRSGAEHIEESTVYKYRYAIKNYSGDWMNLQLASITREQVEARHQTITKHGIWFGGPSRRKEKGSKSQADFWARVLRAVYQYAYDSYRDNLGVRLLPDPPTTVLSTKRLWNGNVRKTTRIRNVDLGRWLDAVDSVRKRAADLREDITRTICDAVDVALFTGLRRSEIFGLEWSRVNLPGRYFWIDKTKNGEPLELPITGTLHEIFERRQSLRCSDSPYVFPGARGGIISNVYPVISQISRETARTSDSKAISFSFHDARRTFGSIAELEGVGPYILKRLMNHKVKGSSDVTQGYLYYSSDELRGPANKVERAILEYAGRIGEKTKLDHEMHSAISGMNDKDKELVYSYILSNIKR